MKYDDTETTTRWLILNDKEQQFPTDALEVSSCEERKTQAGKTMPVLTLTHPETGEKYQVCAWKRDVIRCINEYGTDTDSWSLVKFEQKNGRWMLVPAGMNVKTEVVA